MVRGDVAVVARAVVQQRHLSRLADVAQGVERPVHGRQRKVRVLAPHAFVDRVGTGVLGGRK